MVIILAAIFFFILSIVVLRKRSRVALARQAASDDRAWIRDYLIGRNQYTRVHQERETVWWQSRIRNDTLEKIKRYIVTELSRLPHTDWEKYVLDAIYNKSTRLGHYLTNGRLDLNWLAKIEEEGIRDAIKAIRQSKVYCAKTLRQYFHLIFENIVSSCRSNDYFYLCGQLKVLRALKSYLVSAGRFQPSIRDLFPVPGNEKEEFQDSDAEPPDIFGKLAVYYGVLEEWRKKYLFEIDTANRIIEFDLEKIEQAGSLQYQGSLLNFLFLELRDWLVEAVGAPYAKSSVITELLYDAFRVECTYGVGTIYLVKVTGMVDYFPDRLYVEFENLTANDPIIQKLRVYKIRLEGDD